jgi:FlaA1/EpsC-like NDP-sugar epimerase
VSSNTIRAAGQAFADFLAWVIAVPIAMWLRFDFATPPGGWGHALAWGAAAGLLHVAIGYARQLYRGRYRFGSFDEVSGVVFSTAVVSVAWELLVLITQTQDLPRSIPLVAGGLALAMQLAGRFSLRFWRERVHTPQAGDRTLVYGAGDGGQQLVRAMVSNHESGYYLVGLIDDDPSKRHLRMQGVRVRGTIADLEHLIDQLDVQVLVVAIANVGAAQLRELDSRCRAKGVQLRVIPSPVDIVRGTVRLSDVSEVTEEDLLGRRPIHTDESEIAGMLQGKRVLITGAGGSIGSELARQVNSYQPAYLGLLDRDESALHALHLTMFGKAMGDTDDLILADIRDPKRLREILQQVQPDVVFHAAALKHLPMLEAAPSEAFKTNVLGTRNVLQAAYEAHVPVFVNISTDKAADPVSVLGHSKRTTERLTAGIEPPHSGRYLSVRFGNVLGSRGSVLTAFRAQIANGGPVTVTHPEVTRYFMTVREAVHLVLQAATLGRDSETLILDMGEPVRIADVANHMIEKSGRDIEITYTGLREGEKLHEVLSCEGEHDHRPLHPLITHVEVPPLAVMAIEEDWAHSCASSRSAMQLLALASSHIRVPDEVDVR